MRIQLNILKYRANEFSALLSNYKMYEKILGDYENASGSAASEAKKTADSIEGRLNKLSNTWNRTVANVVDSDILKALISIGSGAIDLTDKLNLLQTALIGLTTFGALKGSTALISWFKNGVDSAMAFGKALNTVKTIDSTTYYSDLTKTIQGLSISQASAVLATQSLSKAEIEATLINAGFSAKEASTTASTLAMSSAETVATGTTWSLKNAFTALWATIKANPIGAIVTLLTTVFSVMSLVSSNAKQKQEELNATITEQTQKSKSLTNEITNLTVKYNELTEKVKTDKSAKDDLLTTQTELLTKLGLEGQSIDSLIKKYGSLNEAIKSATLSQLKDSETSLTASYDKTKNDLIDKAKYKWADNEQESMIFSSTNHFNEIMKVLKDAGLDVIEGENKNTGYFRFDGDVKTLKGVIKNYNDAKKALQAIENSGIYGSKDAMLSNDLYKKLQERYNNLKPSVDAYNSAISDLNINLAQQQTLISLQGKDLPATQEEFNKFKQSLIDSSIASGKFIGSEDQITASIENFLATQPEFVSFINTVDNAAKTASSAISSIFTEEQSKSVDDFQKSINSISSALSKVSSLSSSDILDFMQEFSDFDWALYGVTGEKGVGNLTSALKALATQQYSTLDSTLQNNTAIKALYNECIQSSSAVLTLNDALTKLSSTDSALDSLKKEIEENKAISMDTINSLLSKYPELTDVLNKYLTGLANITDVIDALSGVYQTDLNNWETLMLSKFKNNEEFINKVGGNNAELINKMKEMYGIDISNDKTYYEKKMKILSTFLEGATKNWQKYYNIDTGKTQNLGDSSLSDADRAYISKQATLANEALTTYENSLDFSGIEATFDKANTDTDEDRTPAWLKSYNNTKADYDHQLAMDEINEETYYNKLEKLSNKVYKKHKKDFEETYRKNQEDIYKGRKSISEDAIKSQFDELDYEHNIGKKTDAEYYKERLDYANKYYKKNGKIIDEYLNEYRSIYTDYYKSLEEQENSALDTISSRYQSKNSTTQARIDNRQSLIDLKKAQGKSVSKGDYQYLINREKTLKKNAQDEYKAYNDEFQKQINNGNIKIGDAKWKSGTAYLINLKKSITEIDTTIAGFNTEIRELKWKSFDDGITKINNMKDELSDLSNLIKDEDAVDKNGNYTNAGITKLGLIAEQINQNKKLVDEYNQAIKTLGSELTKGTISQEQYNEELVNYKKSQREAIADTESLKDSIVSLAKARVEAQINSINKETEAVQESTNAVKKSLDAEKELHDYKESVKEKTNSLAELDKKIAVLRLSTDRKSIAQRLQLEKERADKQKELEESNYDHTYDAQVKALDEQQDSYEKSQKVKTDALEKSLEDQDTLVKNALAEVLSNTTTVSDGIKTLATEHGITITNSIVSPWQTAISTVETYKQTLNSLSNIGNTPLLSSFRIGMPFGVGIRGYKTGTKKILEDQLGWTQENGGEILVSPTNNAMLTPLSEGDSVFNADLTKNLMDWGKINPNTFNINTNLPNLNTITASKQSGAINVTYGSLISVGEIKGNPAEIESMIKTALIKHDSQMETLIKQHR